jgi:hypothetical protein
MNKPIFGTDNPAITHEALSHFHGSEQMFFHPMFKGINYTDGVRFLMHNRAAGLIEAILSHKLHNADVRSEEFIVATLKVTGTKAVLTFDDGNDNVLARQVIEYTDFPLKEISFYLENDVLMLPSER